jgi:hypothetical protein
MNNIEIYKKDFLFLLNKCILLFKYIDIKIQHEILNEIKLYIQKLDTISSTYKDKIKIFEILIEYFNNLIYKKIYNLIDHPEKNNIIEDIDKQSKLLIQDSYLQKNKESNNFKEEYLYHLEQNNIKFENKINIKLEEICNEIKNNLKISLKEYFNNNKKDNIDTKLIDEKINNKIIPIIEELEKKNKLYDKLNNNLRIEINEIYEFVNTIIKDDNSFDEKIKELDINNRQNLETKIKQLVTIFNDKIEDIFYKHHNIVDKFEKNNFKLQFNKETNEIKLYYEDNLISSTNINIKGLIGPKGPDGKKGDTGESPIFRNLVITQDNRLKFIIQDTNTIYELISDNYIPSGPPGKEGPKGDKGEPGRSFVDLKLNQENIMRIDKDEEESLILLKSLCIGDKSHCLKENSISVGGGICYKDNSVAFGNNSKTLDSNSIAFFGTCIGKNSLSYRAENVDENRFEIGKKDKNKYDIELIKLVSKEIFLDCDKLHIQTNLYENNKIKELEERINYLEKKIK